MRIPDRKCDVCGTQFNSHFWVVLGNGIYTCAGDVCISIAVKMQGQL